MAVCARIGPLEHPIHVGRMTHCVRDTDYGCEMRSRFWLGLIKPHDATAHIPEQQIRAMRAEQVTEDFTRVCTSTVSRRWVICRISCPFLIGA